MHQFDQLGALVVIFAITLPMSYLLHRLHCPVVVGYILAGVFIGPHALGVIKESSEIELLSEIGIVLLLFTVGMELSLSTLIKNLKTVCTGGSAQFVLNGLVFMAAGLYFGMDINQAIFFASLTALSSTAIVLKSYTDRGELDSSHGQICSGILLFQDLLVIPLMLIAPFLSGTEAFDVKNFSYVMLKSAFGIAAIFIIARLAVPRILSIFIRLKDREMMLLLIILICMLGAWGAQKFGVSLAMGAFIVGLILSESEYCHHLVGDILPFRDFFSSLFFISIGMMIKLSFVVHHIEIIFLITFCLLLVKGAINIISVYAVEHSLYRSIVSGCRLTQVGEFSFVMVGAYVGTRVVPENHFQIFLACSILSMLITPFLFPLSIYLARKAMRINLKELPDMSNLNARIKGHVIISGFGDIAQYLARVFSQSRIAFIVVDIDHESISTAKAQGFRAIYGDISRPNILELAGIRTAKSIIYTQGKSPNIKASVLNARELNRALYILVRSGSTQEVVDYLRIGVNRVISSEFETTVEIFSRILREYEMPKNLIAQYIEMARVEGYGLFRGQFMEDANLKGFYAHLSRSSTFTFMLLESSPLIGQKLSQFDIKGKSGAVLLSIVRGQEYFASPNDDFSLEKNDLLVMVGSQRQLDMAKNCLSRSNIN